MQTCPERTVRARGSGRLQTVNLTGLMVAKRRRLEVNEGRKEERESVCVCDQHLNGDEEAIGLVQIKY